MKVISNHAQYESKYGMIRNVTEHKHNQEWQMFRKVCTEKHGLDSGKYVRVNLISGDTLYCELGSGVNTHHLINRDISEMIK
jgi:hypothetical protein